MDPLIVGTTRLAQSFAVSRKTVANLADAGMPRAGKNQFDLDECWRWRYARLGEKVQEQIDTLDVDRENARLRRASADLKEIEVAWRRGEIISVHDAELLWSRIVLATRGRILELPVQLAPRLVVCRDAAEMQTVIEADVCAALSELSETAFDPKGYQGIPLDHRSDRRRRTRHGT